MKNEQIIDGNQRIAEFMGLEKREATMNLFLRYKWIDNHFYPYHILRFSSSWDWLMPVVEKIHGLLIGNGEDGFTQEERIKKAMYPPDIEKAFIAVVEFIKWHNARAAHP